MAVDRIDREAVVSSQINADRDDGMLGQATATLLNNTERATAISRYVVDCHVADRHILKGAKATVHDRFCRPVVATLESDTRWSVKQHNLIDRRTRRARRHGHRLRAQARAPAPIKFSPMPSSPPSAGEDT
ncbi:hypothetical protein GQ607_016827 [Colletotrichum asianum]|uniref:Uncharacterized protein n=1 Tax=Colletotrichum asianum TaxID=702518 RepID=A0A8H3W0B0_9PEZI|nr:hypothetical protein GQ607_016827 [Colletotrichum asianum]